MKTRLEPIVTLICLFIVAFAAASTSEKSEADEFVPYMNVGGQVNASDASMGGVGVTYGKYDLSVSFIGEGDTEWGKHESMRVVSLTSYVTPKWNGSKVFYMGVGYANVQDTPLVGEHNFHLVIGGQWVWGRIYYSHISDFDIGTNNNTGLDGVNIAFNL
jgi:hypothetical protein